MKAGGFRSQLARWSALVLDSAILIYHLEDTRPYSDLTEQLFFALAQGSLSVHLSTLTVTELLAKPFSRGQAEQLATCEAFLHTLPHTSLIAPGYPIAREAARLRALYGLRTPDAIMVATALASDADAFLTNDKRLKKVKERVAVVCLEDFLPEQVNQ